MRNVRLHASNVDFEYMLQGKATFSVYTMNGRLLGKSTYYSPTLTSTFIQVPCLSNNSGPGVYLLMVEIGGKRMMKKIGTLN